ncbi:hypothetical protein G6F31_016526 [Rhizopus arrhizus]|nr:hypothetical protein G6F31_016526 [Rhizopus arrhizus]
MQQFATDARCTARRAAGQDHREFVTAPPRHHVRVTHAMAQHTGHRPQHGITSQMAPGVVDRLEAVQVDVHQRGRLAGTLDAGDGLLQVYFETTAVAQFGQRVDLGQVPCLALARTLLGVVAQHPDRTAHMAFVIAQPRAGQVHRYRCRAQPQQQIGMQVHGIAFRVPQHRDIQH